jgi:hypothetical protein
MNAKPILASNKIDTLQGLINALQTFARYSPEKADNVYLDMPVVAALLEETLSDGSKVYNVELVEQD